MAHVGQREAVSKDQLGIGLRPIVVEQFCTRRNRVVENK
jgi:hypothetical protein